MIKKLAWSGKKQSDFLERGLLKYSHRERLAFIKKEISQNLQSLPYARCLDLGCGEGVFLKHFKTENGAKFFGCDLDYNRLQLAKTACPQVQLVNLLAERPSFQDKSFDLVLLHHVLEHVDDDAKILDECRRILKKDGIFIIGVPNEDSINGRISRYLRPRLYKNGEHVHFYSEKKLRKLLKQHNFKILKIKRIGFLFPEYYIHMFLISNRFTFAFGNLITAFFKFCADSLIITCQLESSEE